MARWRHQNKSRGQTNDPWLQLTCARSKVKVF